VNGSVTSPSETFSPVTDFRILSAAADDSQSGILEPNNDLPTTSRSFMMGYDRVVGHCYQVNRD